MHALIRMSDTQRLQHRIMELARQVRIEQETSARLRGELAAAMLPYSGHRMELVNGVPTVFQNSGVVYEMVDGGTFTDAETSFRREWRPLPPIPGSPAARIAGPSAEPSDFVLALEASL